MVLLEVKRSEKKNEFLYETTVKVSGIFYVMTLMIWDVQWSGSVPNRSFSRDNFVDIVAFQPGGSSTFSVG